MDAKKPYCKPLNAGLASETGAVCRRLAKLFEALDTQINSLVVQGDILDDLLTFRRQLRDRLEAEGWTWSYGGGDKMKVRQPGHKKPFARPT